ncbi:MAG: flagellar protein FliT [Sulfuritalea sp.]|nr:flagellar protein FliT [Sulfuritalea sp.]
MPSQIELYEELSLLSARMVEAARASDWESLIVLEQAIAALRTTLTTTPDENGVPISDPVRKHSLIQRILDDDAEVRRHTEPWVERLRLLLGGGQPPWEQRRAAGESSETAAGN